MKQAVIIVLIIMVGVQTFSKWLIILNYEINQDYIAKNLCVNRSKPASCCKGKCFLQKKLAEENDQPSGKSLSEKDIRAELFYDNSETIYFSLYQIFIRSTSYYTVSNLRKFLSSYFQPPQFVINSLT